ncbi:MAG: ATP-binding protein [Alphaproteobacteria bacterium]|nr:ATP-binding protein [Alphaproteobacteria bacterium]
MESKLSDVFNCIANAILVIDQNGQIEFVNSIAVTLFGYPATAFQAKQLSDFITTDNSINITQLSQEPPLLGTGAGTNGGVEGCAVRADGSQIPISIVVATAPQIILPLKKQAQPEQTYFVLTVQELTQQKSSQMAIESLQRMNAIGQLSGGLAHDFNNLLAIIIGNLDLIAEEFEQASPGSNYVSTALRAALRGAELTSTLLTFARSAPGSIEKINANTLINLLAPIIDAALTKRIKLSYILAEDLWFISLNRTEFFLALMNLSINSWDAMPDGGNLEFKTANLHLKEPIAGAVGTCVPGDYVVITVTDTGHGMDSDLLIKVFEPFFTTKPQGKNAGLGLNSVFKIVSRAQGFIDVKSVPGQGTSVSLYLPHARNDH